MLDPILSTANLTRRFGGLIAVDGVALELDTHGIHAIIGPNGAGKSTLVNLLSGELRASAGTVRLRGDDITNWTADRIARHGVARTFQHSNLFPDFSAFENCRLAAQSRDTGLTRCLRPAEAYQEWNEAADRALTTVGLATRGGLPASALSHGERRALEIAMSLATSPSVLLLDEPLAGMGAEESVRIVSLLKQLSAAHAILLIEHDMDAVFALADCLTVMVNGAVLATGEPDAIRANPDVQRAYLGADSILLPV
jgi:branched-chain amino acid transport system ATP-binding protein